ncbi:MAG: biopolymer transporter ExbD [Candidatus Omnitrophota bacterium]|jgi:biopolymer transport protein ExbD
MGSLEFERRKRSEVRIDMTPLIDMVFLLLIFFVLSSHFVSHQGFKVKLPSAAHAQTQKNEDLTITIDKDGHILLAGKKVLWEDLKDAVRSGLGGARSKTVVIKADEGVPLGAAVKIMDIAKDAKASGLVISTQVPERESSR